MSVHRLRRKRLPRWWFRLMAGIAFVIWAFVTLSPGAESSSQQFLIAKQVLVAGQAVDASDFESQSLQIGDRSKLYLQPRDLQAGMTLVRDAAPGELVPLTAIRPLNLDEVPLALQLDQLVSSKIKPGSRVSLWVSPQKYGSREEAEQIAQGVKVQAISSTSSMNRVTTRIEIWVQSAFVSSILLAQSDGSVISAVLEPSLSDVR